MKCVNWENAKTQLVWSAKDCFPNAQFKYPVFIYKKLLGIYGEIEQFGSLSGS